MKTGLLLSFLLSSHMALAWVSSSDRGVLGRYFTMRSETLTMLHAEKGPNDFFGLYDDEELWNVLKIHEQLSEQSAPEPKSAESIHESVMKSYGEEAMQNLLGLHESLKEASSDDEAAQRLQTLRESLSSSNKKGTETTIPPSLHSLVQDAVGASDTSKNGKARKDTSESNPYGWDEAMLKTIDSIRAIACDVDGTLLTSRHTLHPRSRQAVKRAVQSSNLFFPATGKSRKGALDSLGVELGALLESAPGVFLQGLYCVDDKGNVVFEQKLSNPAVSAVEQLAEQCKVSTVAYDGDNLYSTELTKRVMELVERYGEPMVKLLPSLTDYEPGMHKILLLHEDNDMLTNVVRPKLEALAEENNACVTQAVPGMLEWLPAGCSKALGVSKLCKSLGIDPSTELLAIGDAENDVGMLEMAAIGVAMGNASPPAREAADFLMEETNDEGGAGSAMELFGFGSNE